MSKRKHRKIFSIFFHENQNYVETRLSQQNLYFQKSLIPFPSGVFPISSGHIALNSPAKRRRTKQDYQFRLSNIINVHRIATSIISLLDPWAGHLLQAGPHAAAPEQQHS